MKKPDNKIPAGLIAIAILLGPVCASAADDEDWKAARKASCVELKEANRNTLAAERKVVDAIRDSKAGTAATNVLGAAAFAFTGFFFFTWNDDETAEENLADLRNDLHIIKTVAAEKKCEL